MNENAVAQDTVVGIDVAKKKVDLFMVLEGKGKSKVFDNTAAGHREIQRWLTERGCRPAQTHVCLEATGPYSEALASALAAGGWKVSVVNPARIKGFAQGELARNKTDRADAALLRALLRGDEARPVGAAFFGNPAVKGVGGSAAGA